MTALERYVRQVADLMHLKDWQIAVMGGDPPDGVSEEAEGALIPVDCYFSEKAGIWLDAKRWRELDLYGRRLLVVHELMHIHLQSFVLASENGERTALEMTVQKLANVIAPHMPLPPKNARPPKVEKP